MNGKTLALLIVAIVALMMWQHEKALARSDPRRDTGSAGIVLLSAQWCGYCKALRASFVAHSVPFREVDVETSTEGERAYESLHGRAIPITVIGQDVVYGYDEQRIDDLLKPLGFGIRSVAPAG